MLQFLRLLEYHNSPLVILFYAYRRRRYTLKSAIFATFGHLRDLDLDLGSGNTAYRRISLIDLYLHTKINFVKMGKVFVDGHSDGLCFY